VEEAMIRLSANIRIKRFEGTVFFEVCFNFIFLDNC